MAETPNDAKKAADAAAAKKAVDAAAAKKAAEAEAAEQTADAEDAARKAAEAEAAKPVTVVAQAEIRYGKNPADIVPAKVATPVPAEALEDVLAAGARRA